MNILVLMCDHHRFDALGCLGNPLAHTPNLDRLAARSVRFDNCFTQSPVCAPARHSLATGRYTHAHGVLTNNHKPYPGMYTIAHALKPLDYRRFHLGHMHWTDKQMDNGYEPEITAAMWRETMQDKVLSRYDWEAHGVTRRTTAGPSPRTREEYWGYHVATESIRQIEEAVERGESFISWTSFTEPHPPFYPPKEFYELIDQSKIALPEQPPDDAPPPHVRILRMRREWEHLTDVEVRQIIAGYYGMVALVDSYCGIVLDAIDRLGVRDDTVVIWTADHGDQMWEHQLFLKFNMREASIHVPLLIDLPQCHPAVRQELVEHIDLFPTICELTGASCPKSVHGNSLVPLLGDDSTPHGWRDAVFSQIGDVQMIRTDQWKLNVYDGIPGELYDLKSDSKEFYNRISEPSAADTTASLMNRLKAWEEAHRPNVSH
ncbi:sulfatase-like hydrolase/transferase [Candidatus Poribacteria bacterium]|nr:sulfatase-like hydrolase/transferase [Candidatus Poribacteria bacterium]